MHNFKTDDSGLMSIQTHEESMKQRTHHVLLVACVLFVFLCQPLLAEEFRLRSKCKSQSRLSSELVLVRHAKSHFKGVCRDGRAVFEVPAGQEQTMRSMAANVEPEIPNIEERSTRLLISYSNGDSKPSRETLNAANLQMIQDYMIL